MNKDFGDSLIKLFDRVIDEASPVLSALVNTKHRNDVYISSPSILIKYLLAANEIKHLITEYDKYLKYRNIRLIPSTDWAITFFHKDYVLHKEDWMIRKISLPPPANIKKEEEKHYTYNAFFIKIQDMFGDVKPIDPLNN